MKKFWLFVLAMVIAFVPGIFGVFFTPENSGDLWYNALNKSVLTPAGWVFGVAWTILYALLGIALYLVMRAGKVRQSKATAYFLFTSQMFLNLLWSYLFFGVQQVAASLLVLVLLIGISVWMAKSFRAFSKGASYMVWPYIIWMCFALYLNGTILVLN